MALNKTLSFDLELKPGGIPPIIHASQGDIGRMFKANIYWDGAAATSYVSGATVNLRGKKPDKTVFDYTATLAGSMVTFETTEQMTIISGPVECELVFTSGDDVVASANFVLIVEDSPYDPDNLSESEVEGLTDVLAGFQRLNRDSNGVVKIGDGVTASGTAEPIKGFYVHDEATDTDGVAKYDANELSGDIAELADIRVGYDGTTYESAGDAVRAQAMKLNIENGAVESFTTPGGRIKYNFKELANVPKITYNGRDYYPVDSTATASFLNLKAATSYKSLDDEALNGTSYAALFAQPLYFNSLDSYSPAHRNRGNPQIIDHRVLDCSGDAAQQLYWEVPIPSGGWVYFAAQTKVDEYTSGWAGIQMGGVLAYKTAVTDGYVRCSGILSTSVSDTVSTMFIGSGALNGVAPNLTARVKNVVVANITGRFNDYSNLPAILATMNSLYDGWVERIELDTITLPLTIRGASSDSSTIYAAAVLDATSAENRFNAIGKLVDIARNIESDPTYTPQPITEADKCCIFALPKYPASMYDRYSFTPIYQQNGSTQSVPASTTKVLTILTALDYITSIKDAVTATAADLEPGSGAFVQAGDVLTYEDIFAGMMLPSSNSCARLLAHSIGKLIAGTGASIDACINAFVAQMNAKASALGMTDSTFTSPSGLSTTNKMTAMDMCRLAVTASSYPELCRIWNMKTYTVNVKGANARQEVLISTVQDATLEASNYIYGGKTGTLLPGGQDYYAIIMLIG